MCRKHIVHWAKEARGHWTDALWGIYWFLSLLYMECLLRGVAVGGWGSLWYLAAFTGVYACGLTLVTVLVSGRVRFALSTIVSAGIIVLYGSQMVYRFIFGSFYSVAAVNMGGAAITAFWKETLATMADNILWILALLLPLAVLILLRLFRKELFRPGGWVCPVVAVVLAVLLQMGVVQYMKAGDTGYYSYFGYYTSNTISTSENVYRFGLLTTFRLELFGAGETVEKEQEEAGYYIPTETPTDDSTREEELQEQEKPVEYNVLDIDFDALNEMTEDETLLALNAYCDSLTGTNKNDYTGMLSDYNLIVLCAESFSTAAIDPELTPTLYRLANEGIIFQNYYNTFPNTTTDGEYSLCQGLLPDSTRGKAVSSQYTSRHSYLPFTLGNVFSEQAGISCYGYHNYEGWYYGREESHTNMGYTMKFADDGMKFTYAWPASDLEMMEQSVDDYISADTRFHAYYMTFSGHYRYNRSTNMIAAQNYDQVKDLSCSESGKCYLSCNIELDKALEYLMQRLEEAGVADKTAIVLAGDHFPYGLTDAEYSELIGYEIDCFSKYKSTLIFWVGGLEENIVVEEYCCNVDILPTILNLWGFSYDSRMLAGTDVFSDGEHVAMLVNRSFLTDKIRVNATTGEVTYLVDEEELPEDYVENMIRLVETKFAVSSDILNSAYYNFVFETGNVVIGRDSWKSEWIGADPQPDGDDGEKDGGSDE